MKYLLDTDVIIDHLRKKTKIEEDILSKGAAVSIITLGELIYGVNKSDNPQETLVKMEEGLGILGLEILNLNESTVAEFGAIKASLEKRGQRLEDFDLLIAATAKINGLTLVTRNISHFKRIKDLSLR